MRTFLDSFTFVSLMFVAACSSASSSPSPGAGAGAGGSAFDDVHPPDNIDITRCATIVQTSDEQGTKCSACCTAAGMPMSGFIYKDQCTCGRPFDDAGASVCAGEGATASVCTTCCSGKSYSGYAWFGLGDGGSCACQGKFDKAACAATVTQPSAGDACAACCVGHGYMGSVYVGIGTPECGCRN